MFKCANEGCVQTLRRSGRLNKLYDPEKCASCSRLSKRRSNKPEKQIISYPWGRTIKEKSALKADKKTRYTIIGYKFEEKSEVFITTTDPSNPYSKKLTGPEITAMKAWLDRGDFTVSFDQIEDGISVHRTESLEGYLHVRDKQTREYIYTYVPETFFRKL